jgi:hypothetical protein
MIENETDWGAGLFWTKLIGVATEPYCARQDKSVAMLHLGSCVYAACERCTS